MSNDQAPNPTQEFAIPGLFNPRHSDGSFGVDDFLNFTQPFSVNSSGGGRNADESLATIDDDALNAAVIDSTQAFEIDGGEPQALSSTTSVFLNSTQSFEPTTIDGDFVGAHLQQAQCIRPLAVSPPQPSVSFEQDDKASPLGNGENERTGLTLDPLPEMNDVLLESTLTIASEFEDAEAKGLAHPQAPDDPQERVEKDAGRTDVLKKRNRISSSDEECDPQTDDIRSIASMSPTGNDDLATTSAVNDHGESSGWMPAANSRVRRTSLTSDQIEDANASTSRHSFEDEPAAERLIAERQEDADEDADAADKKSEVGDLIADIFGESDDEFAANDENEIDVSADDQTGLSRQEGGEGEKSDDDDQRNNRYQEHDQTEFVSDFDLMTQKRKAKNRVNRRRKRDYDFINNSDDMITDLLSQMKLAAKEDIDLNCIKQPATRKRALLPLVAKELKKADLISTFIECGVVGVMAEWLSLLPDKSLPSLEIRSAFLKILQLFPTLDHQILRSSGIGKAVMLLFKHPKETKENKERAQKLINEWARPIFNLQTDYRSLTKDERTKRDYDHMSSAKKRRLSVDGEKQSSKPTLEEKVLGPGDKGFIGRARVPRPSTKDYVVRPKWNVDTEFRVAIGKKQTASKIDKKIREIKTRSAMNKSSHAVAVSIEGRRMAI